MRNHHYIHWKKCCNFFLLALISLFCLLKGGDLFDAIAAAGKFSEPEAKRMTSDLASALSYLHSLNIVHRDVKPENLFVSFLSAASCHGNWQVECWRKIVLYNTFPIVLFQVVNLPDGMHSLKLGDFGLAEETNQMLYTVCGTPTYVAPEILLETGYGLKVDVWAMGVIVFILLCGYPPFVRYCINKSFWETVVSLPNTTHSAILFIHSARQTTRKSYSRRFSRVISSSHRLTGTTPVSWPRTWSLSCFKRIPSWDSRLLKL